MKKRKQVHIDEGRKKLLRSLSWVTDVLQRYFDGKLNKQEEAMVEEHLKAIDRQTEGEVSLTEKQLDESDRRIRKQIFLRLNLNDPEKEVERTIGLPLKPLWPPFVPFFKKYAAMTAVIAAVVVTSYFLFNEHSPLKREQVVAFQDKTMLLQTAETEMQGLLLPDGTKLYVNGGSQIAYIAHQFNKEKREIWLEGEVFFEVAHNPEKPFIIHSGKLQTVVRGTSFNVKAYQEIGEIRVSVRNGSVEVSDNNAVFGVLTANRQLLYIDKTGEYKLAESNWEEDAAWRERRLILKDANSAELKLRLKQLYGVQVTVEGAFPHEQRFGMSFRKDASLHEVLELIEVLYDIQYKKSGSNEIILYR